MGTFLLSVTSPESLSWIGFVVLAIALVGEAATCIIPAKWGTLHREAAFAFAILAAGGYAVERVGDDAIIDVLKDRTKTAEAVLAKIPKSRTLTTEQSNKLQAALKSFSGEYMDVRIYPNNSEIKGIEKQLEDALMGAGWQINVFQQLSGGPSITPGMVVQVDPSVEPRAKEAAAILVRALKSAALETSGPEGITPDSDLGGTWGRPMYKFRLIIGIAPTGTVTEK